MGPPQGNTEDFDLGDSQRLCRQVGNSLFRASNSLFGPVGNISQPV